MKTTAGSWKRQWKTFERKKEAEAFLDERSQEHRAGDYREPAKIRFKNFAEEWLEKYPHLAEGGLKDSTFSSYYSVVERHLVPFFGEMLLGEISPAAISKDFLSELAGQELSKKTQRNVLLVLRKMLETALAWGYLHSNPFTRKHEVKLPKAKRPQAGRALTPPEIRLLLDASTDDAHAIIATAVLAGMRRAEIFGPRWSEVDFAEGKIHVQQVFFWKRGACFRKNGGGESISPFTFPAPKSEASKRATDLSPELRRILLQHKLRTHRVRELDRAGSASTPPGELDLVFSQGGLPMDPDGFVKQRFLPAVKGAGLGKLRFHDLRHTFGSLKIEQGENLKYVQVQMGHSSINVTLDVYAHLLKESNPEAAAKTDQLIFGLSKAV